MYPMYPDFLLDEGFAVFLLLCLTVAWGVLFVKALSQRSPTKTLLCLQLTITSLFDLAWLLRCIHGAIAFESFPDRQTCVTIMPHKVLVGISIVAWSACGIGLIAEALLWALGKGNYLQSLVVSVIQAICYKLDFHYHDRPCLLLMQAFSMPLTKPERTPWTPPTESVGISALKSEASPTSSDRETNPSVQTAH